MRAEEGRQRQAEGEGEEVWNREGKPYFPLLLSSPSSSSSSSSLAPPPPPRHDSRRRRRPPRLLTAFAVLLSAALMMSMSASVAASGRRARHTYSRYGRRALLRCGLPGDSPTSTQYPLPGMCSRNELSADADETSADTDALRKRPFVLGKDAFPNDEPYVTSRELTMQEELRLRKKAMREAGIGPDGKMIRPKSLNKLPVVQELHRRAEEKFYDFRDLENDSEAKEIQSVFKEHKLDTMDGILQLIHDVPYNETIRDPPFKGEVTTLVGFPREGRGHVDGFRNKARFFSPTYLDIDRDGNLYVAEHYNLDIRKITPRLEVTTIAGRAGDKGHQDGRGSKARFGNLVGPQGICLDREGRLVVADAENHNIRRVDVDGEVTTIGGIGRPHDYDGPQGKSGFYHPNDVCVDAQGNILVADTWNSRIRKLDTDLVADYYHGYELQGAIFPENLPLLREMGILLDLDGPGNSSVFQNPLGIAYSKYSDCIYIADTGGYQVRKIDPSGYATTIAGDGHPLWRRGMKDGTMFDTLFGNLASIAVGPDESVYLADGDNHRIRKISPDYEVTTVAGKGTGRPKWGRGHRDGSTGHALFNGCFGVCVDEQGVIYVGDTYNHCIRKITPMGALEHEELYNRTIGDVEIVYNATGSYIKRDPVPTPMPTRKPVVDASNMSLQEMLKLADKKEQQKPRPYFEIPDPMEHDYEDWEKKFTMGKLPLPRGPNDKDYQFPF